LGILRDAAKNIAKYYCKQERCNKASGKNQPFFVDMSACESGGTRELARFIDVAWLLFYAWFLIVLSHIRAPFSWHF
jgi:hypothetical protein